ncbi:hypothetical protein E0493_07265 [Roseomonas sp. M0104]|uniref:Uncharacterized protein n=1 Tax=Teichococcus coralli TaxID=2545983 RepID=A0A845BCW4_9PROT|nr:hypothetical protein [Pseudoroseomonas coralli]MXP63152.1 hypothetical protein [Pseudoroseomonas coralli]
MHVGDPPEAPLATAERKVRESEDRIARQLSLILLLERDCQWREARAARRVLEGFQRGLGLAWERLQLERWAHDRGR